VLVLVLVFSIIDWFFCTFKAKAELRARNTHKKKFIWDICYFQKS